MAVGSVGCMEYGDPVATLHPQSSTGSMDTYANLKTERLITAGSLIGEVPWAYITVSSGSKYDQGYLELSVQFYDETHSLLQQQSHSVAVFPAKTVWTTFQPVTTPDREKISSVEANIERAETDIDITSPDVASIRKSRLTADAGTGVSISGTVSTGTYTDRIQLIGLVYDSQNRFRGTVATTSERLEDKKQWEFHASNSTIRTPVDQPDPDNYELRIERLEE